MPAALTITDGGLSTTLQDLGRPGYQRFGIPTSGALDGESLTLANRLVGNAVGEGALECTYLGPSFMVEADEVRMAFVGAEAVIRCHAADSLEERLLPLRESVLLHRGDWVSIGSLRGASTLYAAVEGGFAVAPVLGSHSTFLRGALGGFEGRRLHAGDVLPLAQTRVGPRVELQLAAPLPGPAEVLRILPGPQVNRFSVEMLERLCTTVFHVASGSDRTGMRLEGGSLEHLGDFNITSDAVVHGSIQVPGDGKPILLLADRQTTGGYPKIATVISADLPGAGRLSIGSSIRFRLVTVEEADVARRTARRNLEAVAASIRPVATSSLADRLMGGNLVSGVVDAYA